LPEADNFLTAKAWHVSSASKIDELELWGGSLGSWKPFTCAVIKASNESEII
jgi:hypothetical protein